MEKINSQVPQQTKSNSKVKSYLQKTSLLMLVTIGLGTMSHSSFGFSPSAYDWEDWAVHGYSSVGMVSDKIQLNSTLKIATRISQNQKLSFGLGGDVGRILTRYNSKFAYDHNIDKIVVGAEFRWQQIHLKQTKSGIVITQSQPKPTANPGTQSGSQTDSNPTTTNPSTADSSTATSSESINELKSRSNYFAVGAFVRYYLNEAFYLKSSLGLSSTFSLLKTQEILNGKRSLTQTTESYLRPYISGAIGYDLDKSFTSIDMVYNLPTKNRAGYFSYSLNIGVNFSW